MSMKELNETKTTEHTSLLISSHAREMVTKSIKPIKCEAAITTKASRRDLLDAFVVIAA